MPITAIQVTSALVVIDIQKGIIARGAAHPIGAVVQNVVRLVDRFRQIERPVVLVRVGWSDDLGDALKNRVQSPPHAGKVPPGFSDYADVLTADPNRDILIRKQQWGAFYGTALELQLRRRGITDVVLCGVATSIGVESTAREAWERGFNLSFVVDAMTDTIGEAHDRSLQYIFPRIGELGTTDEILALLQASTLK